MHQRAGRGLLLWLCSICAIGSMVWAGDTVSFRERTDDGHPVLSMENGRLRIELRPCLNGRLRWQVSGCPGWLDSWGCRRMALTWESAWRADLVWTDWWAPGKRNNADPSLRLGPEDCTFVGAAHRVEADGACVLALDYLFQEHLRIRQEIRLVPGEFFVKSRMTVRDERFRKHFLNHLELNVVGLTPVPEGQDLKFNYGTDRYEATRLEDPLPAGARVHVLKGGGFGQPLAFSCGDASCFWGLETPLGEQSLEAVGPEGPALRLLEHMGERLGPEPLEGSWAVIGFCPQPLPRTWFMSYLDGLRARPVRPYVMYNSWYDLRSPEYPKVPAEHVMNPSNISRIVHLFSEKMVKPFGINLDAFVLDDGWDVYESDWALRRDTFPDGLSPVAREVREVLNADLGIWFGPTGGYSFRMKRINWMGQHGYETVGEEVSYNQAHLCMGGERYARLFRDRVTEMVTRQGIGYFKWDGIQFSCSEPGHGHPVGIHSRRAIFRELVRTISAVREARSDIFLNITSGTWLSPWWVAYADCIWMDAADHGYTQVASISKRDRAMTYRDQALYDDFHHKDLWFPMNTLMTHGIIKGRLQALGGEDESLEKFTDNAVLYLARGISMIELYVSPDLLSPAEWKALAGAIRWGKASFDTLRNSAMIGGDPARGEAYGWVHYRGKKGIIALRNPDRRSTVLRLPLEPGDGLDPLATQLVLERIYPDRWVSPRLLSAGARVEIPLQGYRTEVYRVQPLEEVDRPLLAGVRFALEREGEDLVYRTFGREGSRVCWLNPQLLHDCRVGDEPVRPERVSAVWEGASASTGAQARVLRVKSRSWQVDLPAGTGQTRNLAVLLRAEKGDPKTPLPELRMRVGHEEHLLGVEEEKGYWRWSVGPDLVAGTRVVLELKGRSDWCGELELFEQVSEREAGPIIRVRPEVPVAEDVLPPRPYESGLHRTMTALGAWKVNVR